MARKDNLTDYDVHIIDMSKVKCQRGRKCSSIIGIQATDEKAAIDGAQSKLSGYGFATGKANLEVIEPETV